MIDEMIESLAQLQSHAAALAKLVDSAQEVAPRSGTGADNSRMISAKVGADGIPESVRVDQHWRRGLSPEKFGAAVLEATQAALGDRLTRWSRTLASTGWQIKPLPAEAVPTATTPPQPTAQQSPRPIDVVAEDLITAFGAIKELPITTTDQVAGHGHGRDRSGKVTIALSRAGLVSCDVDDRWVAGQSAAALMNAMAEALDAAQADLATLGSAGVAPPALDGLFAEALALIRNNS